MLLLIDTYRTFEEKFTNGKYSHKKIWEEISAILAEKGHIITGPQCAAKLRSLKKTYKSVKDHNNLSGNDRRAWQFYEVQEKLDSKCSKKIYSTFPPLHNTYILCRLWIKSFQKEPGAPQLPWHHQQDFPLSRTKM